MAHLDHVRPRNPNRLTIPKLIMFGLIAVGLVGCTSVAATQPSGILPYADSTPTSPSQDTVPTNTPFAFAGVPPEWPAFNDQNNASMLEAHRIQILADLTANPNQGALAEAHIPGIVDQSWNVVFTLPDGRMEGGTATPIDANGDFLTATHVIPPSYTSVTLRQPATGRTYTYLPDQVMSASSTNSTYSDIAVLRLPAEQDITPATLTYSNDCVTQAPLAGTTVSYFGFPYMEDDRVGAVQYTPYFGQGIVAQTTSSYTCLDIEGQTYVDTSLRSIPGSSGAIVYAVLPDGRTVVEGMVSGIGGQGALLQPVNQEIVNGILMQLPPTQ